MIYPSIGRAVLFHPSKKDKDEGAQPYPALICYVHSDCMINVAGFNNKGMPFRQASVQLVQEGDPIPEHGFFAEWMPYQK